MIINRFLEILKSIKSKISKFCYRHKNKLSFYTIIFLLVMVFYQQMQIANLQWRIDYMNDFSKKDSFAHRIYNLEYIQDSHTSDIYKSYMRDNDINDKIFNIKFYINELKWRIMQLEWKTDK